MDQINKHPSFIYRRVDDQAFLTHTQQDAQTAYRIFLNVTETAGCPVQKDKSIIATRLFKFDGYLFDLIHQRVGIPQDKRKYMATTITRLLKRACTKECEKFQGLLEWVTTILIQLRSHTVAFRKSWMSIPIDARVRLSPQAIGDLQRFAALAQKDELWTSMSYFFQGPCSLTLYTDASGHGGIGGYIVDGPWLSHQLPKHKYDQHAAILRDGTTDQSSTYIELVALFAALKTFEQDTDNQTIAWWTDSQAAVATWDSRRAQSLPTNWIIRHIDFYTATHNIKINARWHARTAPRAVIADQLSKGVTSSMAKQVQAHQCHVPMQVLRTIDKSLSTQHQQS
jgi:ribonuclease HI